MNKLKKEFDSVVIGGGIFGLYSALFLAKNGQKVALLEKEKGVFQRASSINQARVHNGYHYPRSPKTAIKTATYYQRFCQDFRSALLKPFTQIYAISEKNSKVSVSDYIKFCQKLNLPLKEINSSLYFNRGIVDAAFKADESCFDFTKIKDILLKKIESNSKIKVFYGTFPVKQKVSNLKYELTVNSSREKITAKNIINTTYANVNEINKMFGFLGYHLKYELCELMLCNINDLYKKTGLTVMDGPFFSIMPFGNGKEHSLSSVKYTPLDRSQRAPQNDRCFDLKKMNYINTKTITWSKAESLAKKYLIPKINLKYTHSIFEIKPILLESETDDSRPTLITFHRRKPNFVSVLAGKISTIYDLDESLKSLI